MSEEKKSDTPTGERKDVPIMEENINSLALQTTDITNNLFGESKTRKVTTLDLTDEKQADMMLNALQDADHILNECVGQTIRCIGVTLTETPVETTNEETGEVIVRKKHSMCLFDENGESYVTGSNACYMSFINIAQLKGMPTAENPLELIPIKVDVEQKGHSYLKLKVAKK